MLKLISGVTSILASMRIYCKCLSSLLNPLKKKKVCSNTLRFHPEYFVQNVLHQCLITAPSVKNACVCSHYPQVEAFKMQKEKNKNIISVLFQKNVLPCHPTALSFMLHVKKNTTTSNQIEW